MRASEVLGLPILSPNTGDPPTNNSIEGAGKEEDLALAHVSRIRTKEGFRQAFLVRIVAIMVPVALVLVLPVPGAIALIIIVIPVPIRAYLAIIPVNVA